MRIYTLKIIEIIKDVEDTITIKFKQPALRKINYKAGQYLTLIFRINGRRYVRPYSFSSAPEVDPHLEVTIKRIERGIVSNHIHDEVKVGDSVEVMEPMGDFIIEDKESIKSLYLWAAGSGITPLISIIKSLLFIPSTIKINLIYGNRKEESAIFIKLISELQVNFPDRFKVLFFYTAAVISENNPNIIEGRINMDSVLKIVSSEDIGNANHYICGPAGLKESVRVGLETMNVDSERIFFEDFELVRNPSDFEDIHTQHIQLKYLGQEHELEVIKGKSILEAALDAGLELPYSCQTGNCSTCKATKIEGTLRMIGLLKDRTDLTENEYLLCCSHPLTKNVAIEIK